MLNATVVAFLSPFLLGAPLYSVPKCLPKSLIDVSLKDTSWPSLSTFGTIPVHAVLFLSVVLRPEPEEFQSPDIALPAGNIREITFFPLTLSLRPKAQHSCSAITTL